MNTDKALSHAICMRYFPNVRDDALHGHIEQMLTSVRANHLVYDDGYPLRQVLVISRTDPVAKAARDAWDASVASVRLQLANGLLYGLFLKGNVQQALLHIEQIATWLRRRPYDVEAFNRYEQALTELINDNQCSDGFCEVQLAKFASIAPAREISRSMELKMSLGALNILRKQHGLRALDQIPPMLADHVAACAEAIETSLSAYLDELNPTALALIREFHGAYHRRYDDLRVYNFLLANEGQYCRNRVQAMRELPWLLRVLSGMDDMHSFAVTPFPASWRSSPQVIGYILHAIDTGKPLFDAISRAYGVPRETVRWGQQRMLPHVRQFAVPRTELLLKMLSWMPREKRPVSDQDWYSMRELVSALLPIFTSFYGKTDFLETLITEPRYGLAMGRWMRELMRPTLASVGMKLEALRQAGRDPADSKEFIDALLRSLYRFCPTVVARPATTDSYQDWLLNWLTTKPLHQIMSLSWRWHGWMQDLALRAVPDLAKGSEITDTWPAVLPDPVRIHALTMVELLSTASLVREGENMHHCVGGYGWKCAAEGVIIISIRHTDGRHLSTAELAIDADSLHVSVRQHKGKQNLPVPKYCEEALSGLVALLNGPAYRVHLRGRCKFQQLRRSEHERAALRHSDAIETMRRLEEQAAWSCVFGTMPDENSACIDAARLPSPIRIPTQQVTENGEAGNLLPKMA